MAKLAMEEQKRILIIHVLDNTYPINKKILFEVFSFFGTIEDLVMVHESNYAVVRLQSTEEADDAYEVLQDEYIYEDGGRLGLQFATDLDWFDEYPSPKEGIELERRPLLPCETVGPQPVQEKNEVTFPSTVWTNLYQREAIGLSKLKLVAAIVFITETSVTVRANFTDSVEEGSQKVCLEKCKEILDQVDYSDGEKSGGEFLIVNVYEGAATFIFDPGILRN